eukprot:1210749-Amphidinium_carterae.1
MSIAALVATRRDFSRVSGPIVIQHNLRSRMQCVLPQTQPGTRASAAPKCWEQTQHTGLHRSHSPLCHHVNFPECLLAGRLYPTSTMAKTIVLNALWVDEVVSIITPWDFNPGDAIVVFLAMSSTPQYQCLHSMNASKAYFLGLVWEPKQCCQTSKSVQTLQSASGTYVCVRARTCCAWAHWHQEQPVYTPEAPTQTF